MIAKPTKSQLNRWGKLTIEKFRSREGRCLAEGIKVVGELLGSAWKTEAILVAADNLGRWDRMIADLPSGVPIYSLAGREWSALSQDAASEGVMAVAVVPPRADSESLLATDKGPLLILHRVNNPNNLGALIRSAHWFGFRAVLVSKGSCDKTNPKVIRTSMGSIFHMTVIDNLDIETALDKICDRFLVIGSDIREGIAPHPCPSATALMMGSESHGLPASLLAKTAERWRIQGEGSAESLSLPQAAAIMMYESTRRP